MKCVYLTFSYLTYKIRHMSAFLLIRAIINSGSLYTTISNSSNAWANKANIHYTWHILLLL